MKYFQSPECYLGYTVRMYEFTGFSKTEKE